MCIQLLNIFAECMFIFANVFFNQLNYTNALINTLRSDKKVTFNYLKIGPYLK